MLSICLLSGWNLDSVVTMLQPRRWCWCSGVGGMTQKVHREQTYPLTWTIFCLCEKEINISIFKAAVLWGALVRLHLEYLPPFRGPWMTAEPNPRLSEEGAWVPLHADSLDFLRPLPGLSMDYSRMSVLFLSNPNNSKCFLLALLISFDSGGLFLTELKSFAVVLRDLDFWNSEAETNFSLLSLTWIFTTLKHWVCKILTVA